MQQKIRYLRLFLPFILLCILFFRLLTVPPSAEQQLASCFGRQLVVQGAVEPLSVHRQEGFSSAILRCQKVYSDTELAYSGRLRVSVKGELPQAGWMKKHASCLRITGWHICFRFQVRILCC